VINPGETVGLYLSVKNRGGQNAGAVTAQLSTSDPYVTIAGASDVTFVSVPRWSTSESTGDLLLEVSAATPVPYYALFHAVLTDDRGGHWEGDFEVSIGIYGPSLRVAETIIDDDQSQQSDGNDDGVVLENRSVAPASGVQARLSSADPLIAVTSAEVS